MGSRGWPSQEEISQTMEIRQVQGLFRLHQMTLRITVTFLRIQLLLMGKEIL